MSKKIEFVVYIGQEFTIEWYYNEKEKSQVFEYFENLDDKQKKQLLKLVKLIGDNGKIWDKTKFRNEGDKIYAFKPQPDRFLCFFTDDAKIVITNAFVKKQNDLPKTEKDRALKHMADYFYRVKKGTYYHEQKDNNDI